MTLPTVINNYQKKLFAQKIKYSYSILSQALVASIAENGSSKNWDNIMDSLDTNDEQYWSRYSNDTGKFVEKYFAPYLKVQSRGVSQGKRGYYLRLANGITLTFIADGDTKNGIYTARIIYILPSLNNNTSHFLSDARDYSRQDAILIFRPNGPNEEKLNFFCWGGCKTREQVMNESKYACNKSNAPNKRLNCGRLLQLDNFEIKDGYPW